MRDPLSAEFPDNRLLNPDAIGDWSFNPSDDDMYRLRVRSVSQDRSCGEVESAPVTVARRSVLRVVPHEPDSAEIVAGRGGSVEVSVSCPAPPAGIEVALSSSDRTLLRLPATATILPGERRVIVALTTDEDGAGEVRITADAPDGTQARLNYQVLANLTAIVLSGGGAKGSFEIGALLYLREIWNEIEPRIICGTSVGAINALALAEVTHSGSVDKMERLWLSLEFNSDMYVESPPVAQASAILGVQISDVILHDAELGSPLNIYGNLVGLTPEAAAWAGAGLAIGGTAGAIVGGIVQIFVDEPADRIADAVSALKNASNFLDLSPTRALIAANVNERSIANSGMQLRLAMVALEDGGLYYATEDGRLIRGHARSSSFREAIVTPQPLVTSAMASSAIPAVFQATRVTTNGLSMHFVDGGVREVLPQQAAVELGAQLIFAISAAPFAPHPAPADPNQSFGDPGRLGAIALRGVDLCVNEVSSEEKAPRAGFCDGRVRVLIQPDIEVHGTTQIDPGLIRINMAYGYFRAFDADRLRRGEIDAFQYLLWGLWAQDLSEQRVFCHRREIIQHMIRARETGFFNHDELQLIRERKNRIAELIIERFDAFGEDGFPRVMRNGTMGDQSALDWCATWELHQNPQRSFLAGVDLWAAQIVAPGVAAEDGGRSSPPVRESNVLSRFPLPQRARDGLRNR
ncbi:MAG: hypothetical protein D6754_09550 [Alphaproteobacteria bacterium]|nr:MAG: hypothetical protein D6754_09550 [Alphaproteobacteria bacterium]